MEVCGDTENREIALSHFRPKMEIRHSNTQMMLKGGAIAQAVRRWLFITEPWIQSQATPYIHVVGEVALEQIFSFVSSVLPC
jgi:hypothetical protein